MKIEIELKEKSLINILKWLGCQGKTDTKIIIDNHNLDLDYEEVDFSLCDLYLELRDKSPVEIINKL